MSPRAGRCDGAGAFSQGPQPLSRPALAARWSRSAKSKGVGLNARIEKLDLEGVFRDAGALANELIKPMLVDDAAPVRIGVGVVISAWRRSIDSHAEPDLFSLICGSESRPRCNHLLRSQRLRSQKCR